MSKYHHVWLNNQPLNLPNGKVVCVGQNYHEHITEMSSKLTEDPVIFLKPATSLTSLASPVPKIHDGFSVHFECELSLIIGKPLNSSTKNPVLESISGFGLGLDLTLRDLQSHLKKSGLPWERSKSFDHSAALSPWIPVSEVSDLQDLDLELKINDKVRQSSNTKLMIWKIETLLTFITRYFSLEPGDVILTGTPAGVGVLAAKDQLSLSLSNRWSFSAQVEP